MLRTLGTLVMAFWPELPHIFTAFSSLFRKFESQRSQTSQHDLLCSSSDFLLWACFCLSYWGNFMPDGQRVTSAHGILEVASVLSENFKSKAQELFSSLDSENMPSLFWHDFGGGTGFSSLSLFYHLSESLGKYYPIEIDEKMPGAQVLLWDVKCALSFRSQRTETRPIDEKAQFVSQLLRRCLRCVILTCFRVWVEMQRFST